jgi:hypothetical protein
MASKRGGGKSQMTKGPQINEHAENYSQKKNQPSTTQFSAIFDYNLLQHSLMQEFF